MTKLIKGDALIELDKLIEQGVKVDAVITDIPYETTNLEWDNLDTKIIDKILEISETFITTCKEPLASKLRIKYNKYYKYDLYWKKSYGSANQAKYRPIDKIENILVFSKLNQAQMTYNPQMTKGKPYKWNAKRSGGTANGMTYKVDKPINNNGTRYPISLLEIKSERGLHPTQKPVSLYEWLIKTYTNENDIVSDPFMGSGTTGVASINQNRNFIGIELDDKYFEVAKNRIKGGTYD